VVKNFEFARYNANSTHESLLTIDGNGEVNRPPTGSANLLPIDFGNVAFNGAVLNGSGNFTVTKLVSSSDIYEITINGVSMNSNNTTALLTVTSDGQGSIDSFLFLQVERLG